MSRPEVIFYTRRGCHLCQEALAVLEDLRRQWDFEIRQIDIDSSPELQERYGLSIPVARLEGRTILKHRADRELLRRVLERTFGRVSDSTARSPRAASS